MVTELFALEPKWIVARVSTRTVCSAISGKNGLLLW